MRLSDTSSHTDRLIDQLVCSLAADAADVDDAPAGYGEYVREHVREPLDGVVVDIDPDPLVLWAGDTALSEGGR